jgi:hypothetical protein
LVGRSSGRNRSSGFTTGRRRTGPRRSGEPPDEVFARFETVPASESETGLDETYVVFGGKRIAKRGSPGTL